MADQIIINGNIWTGDSSRPRAEALAIRGDRLLAVGTNPEILQTAGPKTKTIDAGGALVLPGFIDSHVHFMNGGFALLGLQLRDADSKAEFVRRIAAYARELPKGEWIQNGDWDHQRFAPVELPRKEWIDAFTPDHPVCVNRLDGHMILANSAALRAAGIDRSTPTPPGGEIVKDPATGEPTGILKDAAMDLIYARIPPPSLLQKRRAAEAAMRAAAEKGVTSVHDVSGEIGIDVYQELLRDGVLSTRIYYYLPIADSDRTIGLPLRTGEGPANLRFAGLKGFADGSLGSQTAFFDAPYSDDPKTSGLLAAAMFPDGDMEKRIRAADKAGIQTAIHAIGDRTNAIILDFYERTIGQNGPNGRRLRIEHAQHLRPADFARFGKMGIVASVQPAHLIDDGRWAEAKIGAERAATTYAFRSFLAAGVVLAFGSDWPVASMDPILGIYAAVTRSTLDGKHPGGWIPAQKISVEDAVRAFTTGGAYAEFAEGEKGTLTPGKLADIVLLDRDIFRVAPDRIREARVVATICGGRFVFRDEAFSLK
jgi:hypothetical protein